MRLCVFVVCISVCVCECECVYLCVCVLCICVCQKTTGLSQLSLATLKDLGINLS